MPRRERRSFSKYPSVVTRGDLRSVRDGRRFADPDAQAFWQELPESLRQIALSELAASNGVAQILRNDERGIILLAFRRGPLTALPENEALQLHTVHAFGNYCYNGTRCTVEDLASGCFRAFDDPNWCDS